MSDTERVVYCHCAYVNVVPSAVRDAVLGKLCASGVEVEAAVDLCELSAKRDPRLAELAADATHVIACYPRAVRWLFEAGGAPLPDGVEVLNMRAQEAEAIVEAAGGDPDATVDVPAAQKAQAIRSRLKAQRGDWVPWFPVIDKSRCGECRQCVNFCLFGVYGVTDGTVEVQHPEKCKTWCPACARVCPDVAIVFPKYKDSPIHGGEVTAADEQRERVAIDPAALLQGDVYAKLRSRGKRFSAEPDSDLGFEERAKCLAAMREQLDIPPDVLANAMAERTAACGCACDRGDDEECCPPGDDCGPDCECHDDDEAKAGGCCG